MNTEKPVAEYSDIIKQIHSEVDTASENLVHEAQKILSSEGNVDKAVRLKRLGFGKTKEVKENETKVNLKMLAQQTANIVNYYAQKYPLLKFITLQDVLRICEKYGLVLADASDFTGFIPEKNLKEIEQSIETIAAPDIDTAQKLKIIAPLKDVDMTGKQLRGNIVEDDPIVLQPVKTGYLVLSKWGPESNDESLVVPKLN